MVRRIAVLSLHTSPLAQAGTGDAGGMNVYVRALASGLARAGVECDVFTLGAPGAAPAVEVEPGFRVLHLPLEAAADRAALGDLVDPATDAMRAAFRAGPGYDVLHANYWLSGAVAHRLKHDLDLPLVATFHTLARVKAEAGLDDDPARRARVEQEVVACADLVLASTPAERRELADLYDADPARIEIVPPGVDHAVFHPDGRSGAKAALGLAGRRVLLFVGRIQPLKGVDLALRALADLDDPRAVLLVVGGPSGRDGDAEAARVRDLAVELGLEGRVRFLPPVRHDRLAELYRAADVCLVPSRSESFGLVALEAAACGTPVVAAAVGGLRSLVHDGGSGFLVEGREPAAFAAPVALLLDDPELAAAMGRAGTERSQQYSWATTAGRLRRLYADLAARALVRCE